MEYHNVDNIRNILAYNNKILALKAWTMYTNRMFNQYYNFWLNSDQQLLAKVNVNLKLSMFNFHLVG